MKVVYSVENGEIIDAVYDIYWFTHFNPPNCAHATIEVDEIAPDNRDICRALSRSIGKVDRQGRQRFYVRYGEIWERENWELAPDA
jgi:hypothetical protein